MLLFRMKDATRALNLQDGMARLQLFVILFDEIIDKGAKYDRVFNVVGGCFRILGIFIKIWKLCESLKTLKLNLGLAHVSDY